MNWKETYTKVFLKQSDIAVSDANVKQYMSDWWQNTRGKTEGGLRLTEDGFDFLHENLDIQMYEIPFPRDFKFTTQTYIFLDQFITCPYYLTNRSIWVTDEKKSMELHLFSGDLRKYGLTKAMKRHE
tara:strand:+ start:171 stop:551 length:381 start_codon:yes stop_codon:yes gene_type:complete